MGQNNSVCDIPCSYVIYANIIIYNYTQIKLNGFINNVSPHLLVNNLTVLALVSPGIKKLMTNF